MWRLLSREELRRLIRSNPRNQKRPQIPQLKRRKSQPRTRLRRRVPLLKARLKARGSSFFFQNSLHGRKPRYPTTSSALARIAMPLSARIQKEILISGTDAGSSDRAEQLSTAYETAESAAPAEGGPSRLCWGGASLRLKRRALSISDTSSDLAVEATSSEAVGSSGTETAIESSTLREADTTSLEAAGTGFSTEGMCSMCLRAMLFRF